MFKICSYNCNPSSFYIARDLGNHIRDYLHSNGKVYGTREYWPTPELAQAVLDKYQPPHVWEHGDVFENWGGVIMIYLMPNTGPEVRSIVCQCTGTCNVISQLEDATFLFNIREKL